MVPCNSLFFGSNQLEKQKILKRTDEKISPYPLSLSQEHQIKQCCVFSETTEINK